MPWIKFLLYLTFNRHILYAYYLPCTMPGAWNATVNKENHITLPLRICQAHLHFCRPLLSPVWNELCSVTYPRFCMFMSTHSSRPSSLTSVFFEAHSHSLWPEVITFTTKLLLVVLFILHCRHLKICFLLSSQYRLPEGRGCDLLVFASSTAPCIMPSMQLNIK